MCDIAKERQKIDALIAEAIAPFRFMDAGGEALLVDLACASLGDHFLDFVSPSAIRARCESVVARLLRGRRPSATDEARYAVLPAE
jgi:hypothetical protein